MGDVKIQINSTDAICRLLGDDPVLQVELRNSIVNEFQKKFLKKVAAEQTDKILANVRPLIEAIIKEKIGQYKNAGSYYSQQQFEFNPQYKAEILHQIDETVRGKIREIIEEYFNNLDLEKLVDTAVSRYVTVKIGDEVKRQTDLRLKEAFKNLI